MSIFSFAIWVFAVSLSGALVLVGTGFFFTRGLKAEQFRRELVCMDSFFNDISALFSFLKVFKKFLSGFYFSWADRFGNAYFKKYYKKYYCLFLNFVHGRHAVEKNGCDGYWGKLNGNGKKTKK